MRRVTVGNGSHKVTRSGQYHAFAHYSRHVKRGGRVWVRIFPDKPITKKPAETRMGKGKGNPEYWVAVVKPGRILYEMDGVTPEVAQEALRLAAHKLPVATMFVAVGRPVARRNSAMAWRPDIPFSAPHGSSA